MTGNTHYANVDDNYLVALCVDLNAYLIVKVFIYNIGNSEVNVFLEAQKKYDRNYPSKT